MVTFDRSANGRGVMAHLGEAATIVLGWGKLRFGIKRDGYSTTIMAGPIWLIVYRLPPHA